MDKQNSNAVADEPTRYLLDTNALSNVFEGGLAVDEFRSLSLIVTHVPADELRATRDATKAKGLLAVFEQIGPEETPTRSAVWGVSRWDKANWPDEDGMFDRMLARLGELDAASGKKPKNPANQPRDILTAETAVKNGLTLVTDDGNLRTVTVEFGGNVIRLAELHEKARRTRKRDV
jgi:predicted nucleic acid-binding protein